MATKKYAENEYKIYLFNNGKYVIAKTIQEAISLFEDWKDPDININSIECKSKNPISRTPNYIEDL